MGKVTVIVEKTSTGYSAFIPDVPGVASVADTFGEVRDQMGEAVHLLLETARLYRDPIPEVLRGDYLLEFKLDIQTFMQWMTKVISQRGLSEIAQINKSLISQYASGIKKPSPKQLKKIETAIHRFAEDLHSISF